MWGIELVVMAVMIAINSVFAAFELALASITLSRLELLASENKSGAKAAAYMKRNVEGSLAGIQLGITLVGAIAAATGGAGAEEQLSPAIQQRLNVSQALAELLAIAAVVTPLTFITIIFGELVPKVFALRNSELVCLRLSPPMKLFVTVVRPIVWLLETIVNRVMAWGEKQLQGPRSGRDKSEATELSELRASAMLARMSRLIGVQEEKIILGAAGLTTRPVRNIMLPADAISLLHAEGSIAEALVDAHLDMHTRFPVTERKGDPQAIIGYVNFKDIVAHMRLAPSDGSLRKIMRSLSSFPAEMPISVCLERLIRDRIHIALVRDATQGIIGMVTMEDIMEELVGEIEDEYDHLPVQIIASGQGWVAGGGVTPSRLRELTGIELPNRGETAAVRHLSDWVSARLSEPLRGGEIITEGSLRVVVRKVRRHKVLEAQIGIDESEPRHH